MHLELVTLAERPDLMDTFWDMDTSWPEFMKHDPIGNGYYASLEHFREFVLVGLDESGRMVAKAHSVPFQLPEGEL
ncbi:MAG: N-acetyltransferase, partial [Terrabacter sp.]|nr:N-acetyltransferase [Terrabacter sp.]